MTRDVKGPMCDVLCMDVSQPRRRDTVAEPPSCLSILDRVLKGTHLNTHHVVWQQLSITLHHHGNVWERMLASPSMVELDDRYRTGRCVCTWDNVKHLTMCICRYFELPHGASSSLMA